MFRKKKGPAVKKGFIREFVDVVGWALVMAFLARLLSPIRRMACGPGPMNFRLQASQISARYADSDKNP